MTILIVEDQADLAHQIARGLKQKTRIAGSLREALGILETDTIDLILLDLGLPDSSGLDTLRALSHIGVPKIVVTANEGLADEAGRVGCLDYILKMGYADIQRRIQFNVDKLLKPRRPKFSPQVFEQLKAYVCPRFGVPELTLAR